MKRILLLLLLLTLIGCGGSYYGRSGSGGTAVGGSVPAVVW